MRVAIINLTGGGISGGYRQYLRNVIPRMAAHSDVESILCAAPKSLNIQDWFDSSANVRFVDCKSFRFLSPPHDNKLLEELKSFHPHVIFVPVERFFAFHGTPVVNMVQNMEPFVYSNSRNPFSERIKTSLRKRMSCSALHKSQRIIAVSKFVKEHLVTNVGIPETKISFIYHGCSNGDNICTKPSAIPDNWSGTFLFTAGSIRPARGLEDIIYAVRTLTHMKIPVYLVIAGKTDTNMISYKRSLQDIISKNGMENRVIWIENLNEAEMKWCYKNCNIFIMTSRVESFGMIGLEAMSNGCVCIAANNPCLPEIFEDSAVYYSPRNHNMLAKTIQRMLDWDKDKHKAASERSLKRAAEFSWGVCAEQTVALLSIAAKT